MRTMILLAAAAMALSGCYASSTYGHPPGGYYQPAYLPPLPPNVIFRPRS